MRLTKWLNLKGYNYLRLQGSPKAESALTTKLRTIACRYLKRNVIDSVFKKLSICSALVISFTPFYLAVKGELNGDMFSAYIACAIGICVSVALLWLISRLIVSVFFLCQVTAVSVVCSKEEISEKVVIVDDGVHSSDKMRWVIIEVCKRSYAMSYDTLTELAFSEERQGGYVSSI